MNRGRIERREGFYVESDYTLHKGVVTQRAAGFCSELDIRNRSVVSLVFASRLSDSAVNAGVFLKNCFQWGIRIL